MRVPIAIVLAGLLIGGAIMLVFRWQIAAVSGSAFYRLDRWNGHVFICGWSAGIGASQVEGWTCDPLPVRQ